MWKKMTGDTDDMSWMESALINGTVIMADMSHIMRAKAHSLVELVG